MSGSMQKQQLIGLSGTNGAGKDAVGLFLAEKHHYLFVSVTDLLRNELKQQGKPVERRYLSELSAEWRREFGMGVLVDRAIKQFEHAGGQAQYAGLVLASLRNPFEVDRVHELNGLVLWVDADPRVRYDRVRNAVRDRAGEDNKTFEQFLAEEQAEMHQSGDAATLNMSAVKNRADATITNDSADLKILERHVEKILGLQPAI
jgi:dephospho-CoA kinase